MPERGTARGGRIPPISVLSSGSRTPASSRDRRGGATLLRLPDEPSPLDASLIVVTPQHKPRRPARDTPRIQDTFRLSADGLAKVLGDLEARVMRVVWDSGEPIPARGVHDVVIESHEVAPLTVITVLNKLVMKGLLRREKRDDLFHYQACWSEEEFMAHASRRVVEGVLAFEPDVVAASFVDVLAERDPERLADLARLIRRRLRKPK